MTSNPRRHLHTAATLSLLVGLALTQAATPALPTSFAGGWAPSRFEIGSWVVDGTQPSRAARSAMGDVPLVIDDGGAWLALCFTTEDEEHSRQVIWLNRFTPDPLQFPFQLDQIQVLFLLSSSTGVESGDPVDLVVYEDSDEDPSNGATWRATFHETVQAADSETWSVYDLSSPIAFDTPGDVLIGVINRYVDTGSTPRTCPGSLDTTDYQERSWVGFWSTDPPDPALLPADEHFSLVEEVSLFKGNWMIRGYGQTGEPANAAPTLAWTGEANYTEDGLHPQSGDSADPYVYRTRYADADGDEPGYVRVRVQKGGADISGSPFVMECADGDYVVGVVCSHTQAGLAPGEDYTYRFEGQDSQGNAAVSTQWLGGPQVAETGHQVFLPILVRGYPP